MLIFTIALNAISIMLTLMTMIVLMMMMMMMMTFISKYFLLQLLLLLFAFLAVLERVAEKSAWQRERGSFYLWKKPRLLLSVVIVRSALRMTVIVVQLAARAMVTV